MISRMQGLKRKMETLQDEEKTIQAQSRKRIQHLEDMHRIPSLADVKYDQWSRVRLDRLLVDHLLRTGHGESAKQLAKEKGIEDLVDLSVFVQCQRIADSLRRGETKEALQWCGENKAALKKSQVCFPAVVIRDLADEFSITWSLNCGCSSISKCFGLVIDRSIWRRWCMRGSISRRISTPSRRRFIVRRVCLRFQRILEPSLIR